MSRLSSLFKFGRHRVDDPSSAHVGDLLAKYASDRLDPADDQLSRVKSAVLQACAEQRADLPVADRQLGWLPLRWAATAALAMLVIASGTAAAGQTDPGEPLYGVRLTIESMLLPSEGTARMTAVIAQLDARLDEAHVASRNDHAAGVTDAVRAYQDRLATLLAEVERDEADVVIATRLLTHIDLLEGVLLDVPTQAQPGVHRALEETQRALQVVDDLPVQPPAPAEAQDPPRTPVAPGRPGPPETRPGPP